MPLLTTECTCSGLRRTSRALTRLHDRHLAPSGLKATQFALLARAGERPRPMTELAELLGVERTTLTRHIGPLVQAGWIQLAPGNDPRQRIVRLTPPGKAKLRSARPLWAAAQKTTETRLGAKEASALRAQLESVVARLSSVEAV